MIVGLEIDFAMSISPLKWIALGAALAAIPAACKSPEFKYGTTTDSSTGGQGGSLSSGSSGTAGTAGSAGTGSSSTSSSSSSSSSSASSSGMPAMCRPLHDAEDCGAGKRCTVLNENNGDTHCVAVQAPTKQKYESCVDDKNCPAGTWCDWRNAVCAPFCDVASDCVGDGDCVGAVNGMSKKIPGITICTANCDPASLTSCGPGAACNYDNNLGSFDCFYSQKKGYAETCEFADCGPTLVCASGACEYWCHPIDSYSDDCFGDCGHFSNLTPKYNGETYGFCL